MLVTVTIALLGLYLDRENQQATQKTIQEQTERDARLIQNALSRQIHADMAAADYLTDMIAANPDLNIAILEDSADSLLKRNRHFASIGFAPNFKLVSTRYAVSTPAPAAGNLAPTAVNLLPANQTRLHRDGMGKLHLTVPVRLASMDDINTWGAVVFTIDEEKFFQKCGLMPRFDGMPSAAPLGLDYLDIAIRELNVDRANAPFFGSGDFGSRQPVSKMLAYPGGAWEILVAPKEDWQPPAESQFPFRLVAVIAAISMIIPVFIASILINERNRNISELKQREEKLIELSKRFNLAMETSNIGIWEMRESDQKLLWDSRAAALHGVAEDGEEGLDRLSQWAASVHPLDRDMAEAHFFQCTCHDTSGTCEMVYRVLGPDGEIRYLRSVGSYFGAEGQGRIIGIVWDITADRMVTQTLREAKETSDIKNAELELALDELSSREHELEELSSRFDLALASYNCGTWEGDPVSGGAVWDERMHQLYGLPFTSGYVSEEMWLSCLHPDTRKAVLADTRKAIVRSSTLQSVQHVVMPDGSFRFVRSVGQMHTTRDGKRKVIGIGFDVTADMLLTEELKVAKEEADARNHELELAKNRIEYNALHDPLTGLANRRKFDMELDEMTRAAQRGRVKFAILHLDLDRFKEINDTLGHAAGDAMLVNASKILARNVPEGDLVARIGGDEFVILAKSTTDQVHLAELCEKIIHEMGQPIDFEGFSCRCGVSIGIAHGQGQGTDARKVLINADLALYEAKDHGRNCYEFFSENLQANIISSKRMADEILSGLDNDEFTAWYQPQFCANTMELTGVEALVRWDHPTRGILASGTFLKIAEDLNVMARIDQLVLERTLRDRMVWTARGIKVPRVSVNVSSRRLHDKSLIDSLEALNLEPGSMTFELVESIFLDESEDIATDNIDRIKALGIDIEIDDFGTGHTSIVSLLKLKPKRLKIDRQLVMPIVNSPQERTLVRSIIDIARSLGVETVAEGVETREHAMLLRDLGCDFLQGYAFAKPLSPENFQRFVAGEEWRKAS